MIAGVTWPDVALAVIPTIASLGAAYIAYLTKRDVRTPSGRPIGSQVEDTLHTAIANHHYVNAISEKIGAERPQLGNGEAEKVEALQLTPEERDAGKG
jgi:hypothetical protein